jgi:hypothetical protein
VLRPIPGIFATGLGALGSDRLAQEAEASRLINLICGELTLGRNARSFLLGDQPHPLKPLYGQFADPPGVGPFHDSEEAMAYCLDAPLLERIVTVNDDVAAAQLGPIANLSVEAVHRRYLTDGATGGP